MAGRVVAVAVVVVAAAGTVGAAAPRRGRCVESVYRPDAPLGTDSTVWLYVFRLQACMYHSGIGTQGAYWAYATNGQYTSRDYRQDRCNGPLVYWYELGQINKTKAEVKAIVTNLVKRCYPGYRGCWKFLTSHYSIGYWNCNYFTHHLADALGVVDAYPAWLWGSLWPGFSC